MRSSYYSDNINHLLKQNSKGRLHSVFNTACNIDFCGNLVTLLAKNRSLQPSGIVLQDDFDFSTLSNDSDFIFNLTNKELSITGNPPFINISLVGAEAVNLCMKASKLFPSTDFILSQTKALQEYIFSNEDSEHGLAPMLCLLYPEFEHEQREQNIWCHFLINRVQSLEKAILDNDICLCSQLGPKIMGCGPGLTPSSDDFLVGLFAALYKAESILSNHDFSIKNHCHALAARASEKTGRISAHFLELAASGYFSADVNFLMECCYAGSPQYIDAIHQVASHGFSSGFDILTGIVFGNRIITKIVEQVYL